jgi:zinc protease
VFHPSFPQNELDRLRKERIAAIEMEKSTPDTMALRVLPKLIYGSGHPYGAPFWPASSFPESI